MICVYDALRHPPVHALTVPALHAQEIVIVVKPELHANGSVKTNPNSLIRSSLKLSGISARVSPHGATSASSCKPGISHVTWHHSKRAGLQTTSSWGGWLQ